MQEQTQLTEPIVSQTSDIPVTPAKSNRSLVVGFAIVAILLVAGSVFAGIQIGKKQAPEILANPTLEFSATEEMTNIPANPAVNNPDEVPTLTEVEDRWLSYTHQKFLDLPDWEIPWKGFTMYYPPTWKLSEDRVATTPSLNLKITKTNGDYLEIIQAAGGGGYCLFPDQPEYATFDGMATQYTKYIEINKGNGVIWRLADWPTSGDMWSHQLCESFSSDMFENGFTTTTSIGFTKIKVTSPEALKELTEILTRIEIAN